MEVTKHEARKPDVVTAELKKGFEWTTQHSFGLAVATVALLALAGLWTAWSAWGESKEAGLQEKYYEFERTYLEKKEKFNLYSSSAAKPADPKDPKSKATPVIQGEKSTGDLNQDYGAVVTGLENLVKEAPKSKAGALAALTLVSIYDDYGKKEQALTTLRQVDSGNGLLSAMAQAELGTKLANSGDCAGAINQWANLVKHEAASFMAPQLKLKMGICSETLGQKDQALKFYQQAVADAKDSAAGKSAQKYMKLLESGAKL